MDLPCRLSLALIAVCVACCSCTPISNTAKRELARPINCHTANVDVQSLTAQKVTAAERFAVGVSCILPNYIIWDLTRGNYYERLAVASGELNEAINAKTWAYARQCGVKPAYY